jgi:hypothetical protein
MIWYMFCVLLLAYVFTSFEMRSCRPDDKYNRHVAQIGIFAHHILQILVFVTPFTPYFRTAHVRLLYFYLFMFTYVLLQNNWINAYKAQSCVLSMYTNRKCNLPEDAPLRDPIYYAGLKQNLQTYKDWYTIVVFGYIIYILWLLKTRQVVR